MLNFWKGKKVLVTGASGFIGSHFMEELIKERANVFGTTTSKNIALTNDRFVQIDLRDNNKFDSLPKKIDTLIHCAGLDGNSLYKKKNSALILDTNLKMTFNILNYAKDNNIKTVVLMSSSEIYPINTPNPKNEDADYLKNFNFLENGYILAKRLMEIWGRVYAKEYKMNIFIVRPTNTYGPRDKFDKQNNRVIPSFIRKISLGKPIEIWGNGDQIKSFIYVKDLVRNTMQMIKLNKYHILNIATSENICIKDLAILIGKISQKKIVFKFIGNQVVNIGNIMLDINRLQHIKEVPFTSLEEGLNATLHWYKSLYNKAI